MHVTAKCEVCDFNIIYDVPINVSATGINPTEASEKVQKAYSENIAQRLNNHTYGLKICPGCGYVQSWMLKRAKEEKAYIIGRNISIILLIFFLVLIGPSAITSYSLGKLDVGAVILTFLALSTMSIVAGLIAAVLASALYDPNRGHKLPATVHTPEISFDPLPANMSQVVSDNSMAIPKRVNFFSGLLVFVWISIIGTLIVRIVLLNGIIEIPVESIANIVAILTGALIGGFVFSQIFARTKSNLMNSIVLVILVLISGSYVGQNLASWQSFNTVTPQVASVCDNSNLRNASSQSSEALGRIWVHGIGSPASFEHPVAATLDELDTLICIRVSETTLETCQYENPLNIYRVPRVRRDWTVRVINWETKEVRATRTFQGAVPEACITDGRKLPDKIYGNDPEVTGVTSWLANMAFPVSNPTSTPTRIRTGKFLQDSAPRNGQGMLTIYNGQELDAVAVLIPLSGTPISSVYIRSKDDFTITGIVDGIYNFYFTVGEDWDDSSARFVNSTQFFRFEDPLSFETTRTLSTTFTVTLQPVFGGTAETAPVDAMEFPDLK